MFVTTTIAVIYFTVFVQGITVKPLVKFLNVKRAAKKKPTMNERIHERVIYGSRRKCESSLLMFFDFRWSTIWWPALRTSSERPAITMSETNSNVSIIDSFALSFWRTFRWVRNHVTDKSHGGDFDWVLCFLRRRPSRKFWKLIRNWRWRTPWISCDGTHQQLVKCQILNRWALCFAITRPEGLMEGSPHRCWTPGKF